MCYPKAVKLIGESRVMSSEGSEDVPYGLERRAV
jgi:hypothetical protein